MEFIMFTNNNNEKKNHTRCTKALNSAEEIARNEQAFAQGEAFTPLFSSSNKFVGFSPKTFKVPYGEAFIPLSDYREIKDKKNEAFLKESFVFDSKTHKESINLFTLFEQKSLQLKAET